MVLQEIKDDALLNWFSEDGLMLLTPEEERPPFPGQDLTTAGNDNGILFAAYFYALLYLQNALTEEDKQRIEMSILRLCKRDANGQIIKGLFNRNPGREDRDEQHDNYTAIVFLAVLIGKYEYIEWICDYGERNGYIFNNVNPEQFRIKLWRQGSQVSFYKMALGRLPAPWELLWFILSDLHLFFLRPLRKKETGELTENTDSRLLSWLQYLAIYKRQQDMKPAPHIAWSFSLVNLVGRFVEYLTNRETSGLGICIWFRAYFKNPAHPNRALSANQPFFKKQ